MDVQFAVRRWRTLPFPPGPSPSCSPTSRVRRSSSSTWVRTIRLFSTTLVDTALCRRAAWGPRGGHRGRLLLHRVPERLFGGGSRGRSSGGALLGAVHPWRRGCGAYGHPHRRGGAGRGQLRRRNCLAAERRTKWRQGLRSGGERLLCFAVSPLLLHPLRVLAPVVFPHRRPDLPPLRNLYLSATRPARCHNSPFPVLRSRGRPFCTLGKRTEVSGRG